MSKTNEFPQIGIVIGQTKTDKLTFEASRPISIGEYVIMLNSEHKKVLGVVESSSVKSEALSDDIANFEEALESKQVADENRRDKSYKANVKILGFLDELQKSKAILPDIPPLPGTEVFEARPDELNNIFNPIKNEWLKIGTVTETEESRC